MLVRILSNIASFLGNARHRAILVSCLVLVFATSSVVGILAMHEEQSKNAAKVEQAEAEVDDSQEDAIWLRENQVDNKDTLETDSADTTQKQPTASATEPTESQDEQATPSIEVSLSEVKLQAGKLTSDISAGITGDVTEMPWEMTIKSQNPNLKVISSATTDKIHTFRIEATGQITPGEYALTIQATNQDNVKITKTLTVIITETTDNAN